MLGLGRWLDDDESWRERLLRMPHGLLGGATGAEVEGHDWEYRSGRWAC